MPSITIDIISDTVCPWCLIGKRRLEKALAARPDLTPQIHWRAYQLHPDMPAEGTDRKAFMAAKFGSEDRAREIFERIAEAGRAEGIAFRFDKITRAINTLDSHRLIRWAGGAGCQDRVVEDLFAAYFFDGKDISDTAILSDIAKNAGMDADLVRDLLAGDQDKDEVMAEVRSAQSMGVQGVPCFILNSRLAVSGAQDPAILIQAMDQALKAA